MDEAPRCYREEHTAKIRNSWMARNTNFDAATVTKDQLNDLREKRWLPSCRSLFHIEKDDDSSKSFLSVCNSWFEKVMHMHTMEQQRQYHTLHHVLEMFGYLDLLRQMDNDDCHEEISATARKVVKARLEMATFFHDAVYNPKSGTNEEDSAELYKCFVADVWSIGKQIDAVDKSKEHDAVVDYILATKHHRVSSSADAHLRMFLDVDMSVLGKQCDSYDAYAGMIRQEYIHVDRTLYCIKRAEILTDFLVADNIFSFEPINKAYEVQARDNLRREIAMLQEGIIPCEPDIGFQ